MTPKHPVTGERYDAVFRQIWRQKQALRRKNLELHRRAQEAEKIANEAMKVGLRTVQEVSGANLAGLAYIQGAAVAFGLTGMAEAIRRRYPEEYLFANKCKVCCGSGNIWLGPPGNKYRADCYECKR